MNRTLECNRPSQLGPAVVVQQKKCAENTRWANSLDRSSLSQKITDLRSTPVVARASSASALEVTLPGIQSYASKINITASRYGYLAVDTDERSLDTEIKRLERTKVRGRVRTSCLAWRACMLTQRPCRECSAGLMHCLI